MRLLIEIDCDLSSDDETNEQTRLNIVKALEAFLPYMVDNVTITCMDEVGVYK